MEKRIAKVTKEIKRRNKKSKENQTINFICVISQTSVKIEVYILTIDLKLWQLENNVSFRNAPVRRFLACTL